MRLSVDAVEVNENLAGSFMKYATIRKFLDEENGDTVLTKTYK
jgi:hypothetical protein